MDINKLYSMSAISLEELKQLQDGILALVNADPTLYYILDEHNTPVEMNDGVIEWTRWHETHKEQVWIGQESFTNNGDEIKVSTRFFGTIFEGQQCFWETVVFVNGSIATEKRHERYQDALEGHQHALEQYREIIHLHKIEPLESVVLEPDEYDTLILLLNANIIEHVRRQELGEAIEQSGIDRLRTLSQKLVLFTRHRIELRIIRHEV
jgi:hypothetical protein